MSNKLIITGILLVIFLGGAVFLYGRKDDGDNTGVGGVNTWPQTATSLVKNSDYEINLATVPDKPQAGQESKILIETTRDGSRVDVYEEDRMLHVILSSKNREDFLHTVSVMEEELGLYSISHEFTESGQYRMWVEIDHYASSHRHGEQADLLGYVDFEVTGNGSAIGRENISSMNEVVYNDYVVSLRDNTFKTKDVSRMHWQVKEKNEALLLNDHEPAIYVIVGPDFEFFRHAHASPQSGSDSVVVEEMFPSAGEYLLWTESFVEKSAGSIAIPATFKLRVTE